MLVSCESASEWWMSCPGSAGWPSRPRCHSAIRRGVITRSVTIDLDTNLRLNGASKTEREVARTYNETNRELSSRGASYAEYLKFVGQKLPSELEHFDYFSPVTPERWEFIRLNTFSDATDDLSILSETPVLLMLGEEDIHVDVVETEAVYRRVLRPDCLTVIRKDDTSHAMGKVRFEDSKVAAVMQALWQPRGLFADGVLDSIKDFADIHECTR